MASEGVHRSWQKFLAPLVEAAIGALAVYGVASQHSDSGVFDSRISVVETRIETLDELRTDVKVLTREVHEMIGEIRARGGR